MILSWFTSQEMLRIEILCAPRQEEIPITSCDNLCDRTVSKQLLQCMSHTTIHLISSWQYMLCYWSYVPFEFYRNTHFKIRSGQLWITSQHRNIVINCHFLYDMLKANTTNDLFNILTYQGSRWCKNDWVNGKMKAPLTVRSTQWMKEI